MAANGTPQSYLAKQRNQNDTARDRSAEQSNTNSGNPSGYMPTSSNTMPPNRYIPPTFNPASGQWNTNGEQYMTPGAWNGNGAQIPSFWQPNFNNQPAPTAPAPAPAPTAPQQTAPSDQTQPIPPTAASPAASTNNRFIPKLASTGLVPTQVPAGSSALNPPNMQPTASSGQNLSNSYGYSGLAPTAVPVGAVPNFAGINTALQQYQGGMPYGIGGLSQGAPGYMPMTRQLVR